MQTWKTKVGEVIFIKDMSDRHLVNSINLVKRAIAFNISQEISSRSEIINDVLYSVRHRYPPPTEEDIMEAVKVHMSRAYKGLLHSVKLDSLVLEANKRGLSI